MPASPGTLGCLPSPPTATSSGVWTARLACTERGASPGASSFETGHTPTNSACQRRTQRTAAGERTAARSRRLRRGAA